MNKALALFLSSIALLFCACGDSDRIKKVKLRAADSPGKNIADEEGHKSAPLVISVASILSPKPSFTSYGELALYLGKRLNMPVKVVFRKKYAETNESLRNSEADIAFICTGGYFAAKRSFPLDILAVPVVNGSTSFNSIIVARRNGPERGFADLKGKVFAFSDEIALGRLYIQTRLADIKQPPLFFGDTVITGSHDNSIKAVAEGFADAACVNSLVYQALLERGDPYAKKLRIIETSPPFGTPPVVAREGLSPGIRNKARALLLGMNNDTEGARILKMIAVERFVVPPPGFYSSAEKLFDEAAAGEAGRK